MENSNSEKALNVAKTYYWNEFCKKAMDCDKAVENYLRKIKKKILYIFEKRKGKLMLFIKGAYPTSYRRILAKIGYQHLQLLEEAYEEALNIAKEDK